jgi:hypothetical protein
MIRKTDLEKIMTNKIQPLRHGDVVLTPCNKVEGTKTNHLILAHGEVTGHCHQITEGKAELYERDGVLYLKVLSATAALTHEEHKQIDVPQGTWKVNIQRSYTPEGWERVVD